MDAVVIGRYSDDDKIRFPVSLCSVCNRLQIQFLLSKVFFNIVILNRRFSLIDQIHFFLQKVHRCYMMMLREKDGKRQAYITCSCYRNIIFLFSLICSTVS